MSNQYFKFKQFTIWQDKCAMKVSTDSVLLGAWTDVYNAKKILDIGTGTGLLALMLAQRSVANIDAIDIDEEAVLQAKENVEKSKWSDRIRVIYTSFQDFSLLSNKYDLIVCNPPYFNENTKSPKLSRNIARHTDKLNHEEIISGVKNIIEDNGRFCIILPYEQGIDFICKAKNNGLFCNRILKVRPKRNHGIKRLLMEFSLIPVSIKDEEIIVENEKRHDYSEQYKVLTQDYYLFELK